MRKIAPIKRVVKSTEIKYCEVIIKDDKIQPTSVQTVHAAGKLSLRDINNVLKDLEHTDGKQYQLIRSEVVDLEYYLDVDLFIRCAEMEPYTLSVALDWAEKEYPNIKNVNLSAEE